MRGLTGHKTCVPETELIPAAAPMRSSFLSVGTSVTFTPCLSQKQLLNQFPLGSENLMSHLHVQVLGEWECYLSLFYPQGGPPFESCLEEDMR